MKSHPLLDHSIKNTNDLLLGKVFLKKYLLVQKLGEGSFGAIYMGIYNNETYALKFEKKKAGNCLLESEAYLLQYLKGPGLPLIKSYNQCTDYNILVMELLGKSLEDIMMSSPEKHLSIRSVCNIGIQMLNIALYIHNKHIVHRDIKPDNFVTGLKNKANVVYMIDFGLSKKYRSRTSEKHYLMKTNKKLTGTARYASINALKGCDQSRRDDLESIGYVLIYLVKGRLPWQGLVIKNKEDRYLKITERKESISPSQLCKGLPNQFTDFIAYTKSLDYEQTPNYDYLQRLLTEVLKKNGHEYDQYCEWYQNPNASTVTNKEVDDHLNPINLNLNEDPNSMQNHYNNNEDSRFNNNNNSNQITVQKAYMNQINNILIINTNHSNPHHTINNNTNDSDMHNNHQVHNNSHNNIMPIMSLSPYKRSTNLMDGLNKGIIMHKPSNQALNASVENTNHKRSITKINISNKQIIHDDIIQSQENEMDPNHENLLPMESSPLYTKKIKRKTKNCTMCCLIF